MERNILHEKNQPFSDNSPCTRFGAGRLASGGIGLRLTSIGISACALRVIAMGLMLVDHLWYTGILESTWWTCLGRLAFPVFAFQIAEGYIHTNHFRRYCTRLLLFALLSEIPFDLMTSGIWFAPSHQNVMFTLLLGLICIHAIHKCEQSAAASQRLKYFFHVAACFLLSMSAHTDYGILGVATVVLFDLLRDSSKLWQLAAMVLLHGIAFGGAPVVLHLFGLPLPLPIQSFAVFGLIPIWLYNGEKGPGGRGIQRFGYCFYPLHMLLLVLLKNSLL